MNIQYHLANLTITSVLGTVRHILIVLCCAPVLGWAQTTVTVTAIDATASELGDTGTFRFARNGGDTSIELRVFFFTEGNASAYDIDPVPGSSGGLGRRDLIIPAGATSIDATVTPRADNSVDSDEVITFRLADVGTYVFGTPAQDSVAIIDDPAIVSVTTLDADASELGLDTGAVRFERSGGKLDAPLNVYFSAEGGASFGNDYATDPPRISGVVFTIPAGATSLDVTLTPIADNSAEGDEVAIFRLTQRSSYVIGTPDQSSVTIADDAAVVTINAIDTNASELGPDTGSFRIERSGGDLGDPLTVHLLSVGTATYSRDWTSAPALLDLFADSLGVVIPAGETFADVIVSPVEDTDVAEGDEVITLRFVGGDGFNYLTGVPNAASVTIANFSNTIFSDDFE